MRRESDNNHKKRQTLEEKRIAKVSFELNIPEDIVKSSIDVLLAFMKKKIETVDLKNTELLSEEEFKAKVPIVKIPHLGFMVPSYKAYSIIKKNQNN
jgi:hypothetical protein